MTALLKEGFWKSGWILCSCLYKILVVCVFFFLQDLSWEWFGIVSQNTHKLV